MEMWLLWIILSGILLILEIFTSGFLLIWPGIGAFLSFIAAICGVDITIQVMIFTVSTILLLLFMKPILNKFVKVKETPMNNKSLIGKTGIVLKELSKIEQTGQIKIEGEIWTAIPTDDSIIQVNEKVTIEQIDGVKLIVKKLS